MEGSSGKSLAEGTKSAPMGRSLISHDDWEKEAEERWEKFPATACPGLGVGGGSQYCDQHDLWYEPECIQYREITGYPHLNPCASSLEILNIGGSNVLGEFIPFLLLHTPRLKSLGQWLNTMIYGLEILKDLPEHQDYVSTSLQEFSYSSDRNYFCQPYIGFVPESQEFKNVRKEMVRYSSKSAQRCGHKQRLHSSKRRQIQDDIELMVTTCPELRKVNLVVHYKVPVLDDSHIGVWAPLLRLKHLVELDLVTMRFDNVRALLAAVGPQLESLTVEGHVHLHGFAFLWGHCQALKYLRIGLVVSNELTNTNVLIMDVFTLLFQVNKMTLLEELHIRSLKVRSLPMATLLLDSLPSLKKASNWLLDLYGDDLVAFRKHVKKYKQRGLQVEYKEW